MFENNSQQFMELITKQEQEVEEFFNQDSGTFKKIGEIRDKHFNQIQTLLKSKFFHGVFKYKDDEFYSKRYLIHLFKDFIINVNKFGIYTRSKYIQDMKFPKIAFRFNGIYCAKILIENTDFEAFKSNLCMYSFIDGYNKMYANYKYKQTNDSKFLPSPTHSPVCNGLTFS